MQKLNTSLFKRLSVPLLSAVVLVGCGSAEKKQEGELWLTMPDKSVMFEKQENLLTGQSDNQGNVINIDPSKTYQEMDGFGYTLTGGSAMHISKMSAEAREKLLNELYGTGEGSIGVSYIRVSIGASDLDEKLFSYNDLPKGETDVNMEKFDLGYDKQYLIPVLQQILKINP